VASSASLVRPAPFAGSFGWADGLQFYIKSGRIFQCPQEPTPVAAPAQRGYSDYWYNARLARLPIGRIDSVAETFLGGDGDPSNARNAISAWPRDWTRQSDSPLSRHDGRTNILWVDGHVKALAAFDALRFKGFDPHGKEPRGE
jgi:prepilin-type processing-associated H-X9-DG protein